MTQQQQQHPTTMTEQQRPTYPPEEVVDGWREEWMNDPDKSIPHRNYIARKAADWQLEQVCDWLDFNYPHVLLSALRGAMRPKPKSLAKLAIEEWGLLKSSFDRHCMGIPKNHIEAALERLKELEVQR